MAEQKSRLVIEISTENAKRNAELLNQELQRLTEKGNKASTSSSALGKELKTTSESAKILGDSTSKATKELAQQESQLNKNGTAVVQLAKYMASYLTISKAISMADGYTQMAARIKNATANAQEYALVQERLYETANTTYRSLAEAQEVYLAMAGGMKSLGYATTQTLDMTDSLSFAFTANATRADQAQSAMDALSKSMAKGKVDADAWISIVTGADNVIADMAKTTAKSEAEIRKLGATGKISLDELIKTLIQTKDANEALANNMENSFADGMQKLFNATQRFLGELNKSTGATSNLASGLGFLADHVDKVAIAGGVMASIYSGRVVAAWVLSARSAVASAVATVSATTAMNTAAVSARALYIALGGPVGVAVAVAGVAASYLLMGDNGNQVNNMLDKQSRYASMAADELIRLNGAQKSAAIDELSTQIEIQNNKLKASKNAFEEVVESVLDANKTNSEAYRIWAELTTGVIDVNTAYTRLNAAKFVTNDQINQLTDSKKKVDAQEEATRKANEQLLKVQPSSEKAKLGLRSLNQGVIEVKNSLNELDEKLAKFNSKKLEAIYVTKNAKALGGDIEQAKALLEFRRELGLGVTDRQINTNELTQFKEYWKAHQELKKYEESITASKREQTKELEKQAKITNRLIGISGNSGIGTGAHLDVRYGGALDGTRVSQEHLSRLNAGGKSLSSYRVSSDYGPRKAPTAGASSFHKGIDFAMPVGTPITTNVVVKDVKTAYDSKGGGYYSTVTFEDGVVLKLLHQSPSMVDKVKGGASGSKSSSGTQIDFEKEILALQTEYNTEIINRAKKREDEINQATLLGQLDLIPKINARYDAQDEIARLQLNAELNAHKWTEEQKLQNTYDINVQRLTAEGKYSDEQKKLTKKALDEQLTYELSEIDIVRQSRIFYAEQAYMHELDIMQERYSLERNEIARIKDEKLKAGLLNASYRAEDNKYENKRRNIWNDYISRKAQREGTLDYLQVDFTKESAVQNADDSLKYGLITEKDHKAELLKIEEDYQRARLQLNISYGGMIAEASARSMAVLFGEQSGAYKAMFAVQKGFAIAQSALAIQQAMANAMSLPFPTNLAAVATVAAETASILSNIQSVTMTVTGNTQQGFSEGGYTGHGGKYDPAGIVHKGEVVFSQADIARLGGVGVVEAMRKGQKGYSDGGVVGSPKMIKMGEIKQQAPVINIHNAPPGTTATQNSDGSIDIDLVERQLANRLSNANSVISKSLKQNTTASRRR